MDDVPVLERVRAVLAEVPTIDWAYVFGSAARGEPFRDVDVAVMPNAAMPGGAVVFGRMIADLEAHLGTKVDLVDLRAADLPLLGAMLPERRVVVDRDPVARQTWEADACSRWFDFRPAYERQVRIREAALRERLRRG